MSDHNIIDFYVSVEAKNSGWKIESFNYRQSKIFKVRSMLRQTNWDEKTEGKNTREKWEIFFNVYNNMVENMFPNILGEMEGINQPGGTIQYKSS